MPSTINFTCVKWNSAIIGQEKKLCVDKKKEKLQMKIKKQNPDWTRKEGRNIILLNNTNWNIKQENRNNKENAKKLIK
jgi:hypothetical protein